MKINSTSVNYKTFELINSLNDDKITFRIVNGCFATITKKDNGITKAKATFNIHGKEHHNYFYDAVPLVTAREVWKVCIEQGWKPINVA